MKKEYDFSNAVRGPAVPLKSGKTRITIRIDDDVLKWFRKKVHELGGGSYQSLINESLRTCIKHQDRELEETFRRIIREEFSLIDKRLESFESKEKDVKKLHTSKADLIAAVSEEACLARDDTERIIDSFFKIIANVLKKEGCLALPGFGTFVVPQRKSKGSRGPQPMDYTKVPGRLGRFKSDKRLKESKKQESK
jgi:nucleoid DNA-binding protein